MFTIGDFARYGRVSVRRLRHYDAVGLLRQVDARLRATECEEHMVTADVIVTSLSPVRVAELTATAASYEPPDISPVITPLFDELVRRVMKAGVPLSRDAGHHEVFCRITRRARVVGQAIAN